MYDCTVAAAPEAANPHVLYSFQDWALQNLCKSTNGLHITWTLGLGKNNTYYLKFANFKTANSIFFGQSRLKTPKPNVMYGLHRTPCLEYGLL